MTVEDNSIVLRVLNEKDAVEASQLVTRVLQETWIDEYGDLNNVLDEYGALSSWEQYICERHVLGLYNNTVLEGVGCVHKTGNIGLLSGLNVKVRNMGYGAVLTAARISIARQWKCGQLQAFVHERNTPSVANLERFGFVDTGHANPFSKDGVRLYERSL